MTILYLVFIVVAALLSYLYDGIETENTHKNHWYWFLCGFLVCLSGFSYGLGGDKFSYMEVFDMIDTSMPYAEYIYFSSLFRGEMPFWSALNMWVKCNFDSFYMLQLIQALIVNTFYCIIVKRYTHRLFLFLLVYFSWYYFIFNTEVMREGLAIAFCLIGIEAFMHKNRLGFLLCFMVGLMFHISAIVVLIFPFTKFRITWLTLIVALAISFLFWLLSDFVISKVFLMAMSGVGSLSTKILKYSIQSSTIFGFIRNSFDFLIFPFVISYYSLKYEKNEDRKSRKERVFSFLVVLSCVALSLAGFRRFRNYVAIYYLIAFADFLYMLFRTKEHLIIRCVTCLGTFFLLALDHFVYVPSTGTYFYEYYVPYTSIIDEDPSTVSFRKEMHHETAETTASDKNMRNIKE